jgi:hypothetical protein
VPFTVKSSAIALVSLAAALGVPGAAVAETPPAPPTVTTLPVTDVTATTATFHAKVSAGATATTAYFAYGTAPDQLTQKTPTANPVTAAGEISIDVPVTRLTRNTKYYVVAMAEDEDWVAEGDPVAFETLAPPEILSGTYTDITHKSATLHLNVATHGQATTISGSVGRGYTRTFPGAGQRPTMTVLNGMPFGPIAVSADGDVAIPLSGLEPNVRYFWSAVASGATGTSDNGGGPFQTLALFALPRAGLSTTLATYGTYVTVKGSTGGRPGLVVTLNEQPYPFTKPLAPLAGVTATADAAGLYAFDVRAERPARYGVSADGAFPLTGRGLTSRLRVAAAVTAKLARARGGRFVVSGRFLPAVAGQASLYRQGAGRVGDARDVTKGGAVRFPARPLRPGRYEVRVTPDATTGYVAGKSATFTVPKAKARRR